MNHEVAFTDVRQVAVQSAETPQPGPHDLLLRTTKTAISTGTELTMLMADFPEGSRWDQITSFPMRPGYCHVGVVEEVGDEVEGFAIGDRVATGAKHAARVTVPAGAAHRIPEGVAHEEAALWMLGRIAFNGVRRARLEMGECVVVYGLGVIGQFVAQLARLDGARPVAGVDLSEIRRDFAIQGGADLVLGGDEDVGAAVEQATRGRMADCVFEVTGVQELIPREMDLLHRQGRIVILSSPRGKTQFDFHDYVNSPSHTIIGAHNGSHPPCETWYNQWTAARNTELLFDLMAAGEVRVDHLITHRYDFTDAPEAYEMLMADRGQAGAVILDWAG
ncbi:MAG: zinc-binding alcohol dehydrogenase [Armatimonadota bacterium]|nr:zinc-binding alcohol dehydrogenase [Armatimonadota bacterium]